MPWYTGPSLIEHLEAVEFDANAAQGLPFRMSVQWVNRPNLDFRGYAGWIARGGVRAGDEILVLPRRSRARVERIVTADGDLPAATEGQSVTLTVSDEIDVSRGDVIVAGDSSVRARRDFKARLLWTGETALAPDEPYFIKVGTALAQARVSVEHTIDIHSFEPLPVRDLTMNGIALASLAVDRDLVALPYCETRELGGFILIDKRTNETVAFGLVEADAPNDAAAPEKGWRAWALPAASFFAGRSLATATFAEDFVAFGATLLVSALLVLALTRSFALALVFAVADAVLRPLVRRACQKISVAHAQRRLGELNSDGGGI
jgi:bifunctional enzyme CysN/CysC